jgi:hypothetical protein
MFTGIQATENNIHRDGRKIANHLFNTMFKGSWYYVYKWTKYLYCIIQKNLHDECLWPLLYFGK